MNQYGLIGKKLSHSFSKNYFSVKFREAGILNEYSYENFELATIDDLPELIQSRPELRGLNVTIPYKNQVLNYIDSLQGVAAEIKTVNTIKIRRQVNDSHFHLTGFNTDVAGFKKSLQPLLKQHHKGAMILGTGGASKAVAFVLKTLHITTVFVSRMSEKGHYSYNHINAHLLRQFPVIINTSPVGSFPNVHEAPEIPYHLLNSDNLLYDLTYNPDQTLFMKQGLEQGAAVKNGLEMLQYQAEESWAIWNNPDI